MFYFYKIIEKVNYTFMEQDPVRTMAPSLMINLIEFLCPPNHCPLFPGNILGFDGA